MKPINKKKWWLLLFIVICGILLIRSQQWLSRASSSVEDTTKESDLYLPEAPYLKFISMGHDLLIADLVLARALIYYGSHYYQRSTFPFKHQKKLFFTAVQMDPMNKDAFLMANNILSGINIQDSIEVLKLGMTYHPDYWKFPEMIGFNYFYHLKNPRMAARYYEQASRLPGHPPYVPSLSGKLYQESGRYEDAIRVLYNFYSTTRDKRLKKNFKDYIEAVKEKIRQKQFQLAATIVKVIDAHTFAFQPDPHNPQFQFLKPGERLRVVGIKPYDLYSIDKKEKLFAYFQQDYVQWMFQHAADTPLRIVFERQTDGRLKQDKYGRYQGSIILKSNKLYQVHAIENGMITGHYKYTFNPEYKKVFEEVESKARKEGKGLYGFPPEAKELKDLRQCIGKVAALRFRVYKVEMDEDNVYLFSDAAYRNTFSGVIPLEFFPNFSLPGSKDYFKALKGRWVKVTGFVGVRNRVAQIKIYFPVQLEVDITSIP